MHKLCKLQHSSHTAAACSAASLFVTRTQGQSHDPYMSPAKVLHSDWIYGIFIPCTGSKRQLQKQTQQLCWTLLVRVRQQDSSDSAWHQISAASLGGNLAGVMWCWSTCPSPASMRTSPWTSTGAASSLTWLQVLFVMYKSMHALTCQALCCSGDCDIANYNRCTVVILCLEAGIVRCSSHMWSQLLSNGT